MFESVSPQDAVGNDRRYQHNMSEETCEDLPGVVNYGGAPVRFSLFLHDYPLPTLACLLSVYTPASRVAYRDLWWKQRLLPSHHNKTVLFLDSIYRFVLPRPMQTSPQTMFSNVYVDTCSINRVLFKCDLCMWLVGFKNYVQNIIEDDCNLYCLFQYIH